MPLRGRSERNEDFFFGLRAAGVYPAHAGTIAGGVPSRNAAMSVKDLPDADRTLASAT
jgi:hypothetical protein